MAKTAKEFSHNNSILSPCKECKERHSGCHSGCEKYKAYKQALYELHRKQYKDNNADSDARGHEVKNKLKTMKRQGRK